MLVIKVERLRRKNFIIIIIIIAIECLVLNKIVSLLSVKHLSRQKIKFNLIKHLLLLLNNRNVKSANGKFNGWLTFYFY